ncbi:MAG TPA: hypothetical protein VE913_24155, partial [Longimicrobium sp.]|nr:hypothetical protein [Longimicrobium sp.]
GELEKPVLWQCGEYLGHRSDYARKFDLERHIRLGTSVQSIRRAPEGGWRLRIAPAKGAGGDGHESELEFDNVVIRGGSNMRPRYPGWVDAERFDGTVLHSAVIRDGREFVGKNTLVVGMGKSGSDVALMAARNGRSCAISTRNGPGYVIPRYYRGLPTDLDTNRCYHSLPRSVVGKPVVRFKVKIEDALLHETEDRAVLQKMGELNRARGLAPFNRFATKSTAFVEAIVHHGAQYRPDVAELHPDRVVFTDGSEFPCDTIVCCTGFAPGFPFLEEHEPELARRASKSRTMYKRMIIREMGTDIAWIGYVRPGVGSVPPAAEMQARYLAQLINGTRALPTVDEMQGDIQLHAELDLRRFPADADRVSALTDFFRFMDTLADAIGCRPSVRRLFLRDPRLALKVLFGPLTGAQYRLVGPGADRKNARAAMRRMPTMPWQVLAYEMFLLVGCWARGLTNEPWRKRSAGRAAGTTSHETRRPAGEPAGTHARV